MYREISIVGLLAPQTENRVLFLPNLCSVLLTITRSLSERLDIHIFQSGWETLAVICQYIADIKTKRRWEEIDGGIISIMIVQKMYCPYKDITLDIWSNKALCLPELPQAKGYIWPNIRSLILIWKQYPAYLGEINPSNVLPSNINGCGNRGIIYCEIIATACNVINYVCTISFYIAILVDKQCLWHY